MVGSSSLTIAGSIVGGGGRSIGTGGKPTCAGGRGGGRSEGTGGKFCPKAGGGPEGGRGVESSSSSSGRSEGLGTLGRTGNEGGFLESSSERMTKSSKSSSPCWWLILGELRGCWAWGCTREACSCCFCDSSTEVTRALIKILKFFGSCRSRFLMFAFLNSSFHSCGIPVICT